MAFLSVLLLTFSLLALMHGSLGIAGTALQSAQTILVGVMVVQIIHLLSHGWPQDLRR
jgi:hypothetical protein